jgi:hypothetical protein
LRGLGGFSFLRLMALSAGQVLNLSFAPLQNKGFGLPNLLLWACRLNGRVITNPFVQLFPGDVLQSWAFGGPAHDLGFRASVKRFGRYLHSQFILAPQKRPAPGFDVPPFLEVDELSLTSVFLYDPLFSALLSFAPVGPTPYLTFRLYNWKYTT